ncbi:MULTISPECIES: TetR/AcrR family transcriptional regulator [unclassified Xanthobacter]|uniref:TetR/AcrR family transcriptional regulator n=1 Tax=unclassified Xanthobacter TaxID=2623496 RepID=UPI001EDD6A0B|nr:MULTISPECIES: TetR/AcrR family transcriptional regulator [unclassified Xanthobacter]
MNARTPEAHRRSSIGARRNPEAEAAILAAARALLAERGYAGFSIEEVARRAGAGKPTIYRWWPTKTDLFIDVYGAEKTAALSPPDTGSLRGDLVTYTRGLWSFWRDTPSGRTFRALIADSQTSESAQQSLRDKFLPQRLHDVRELFARAAGRGEVRAEAVEPLLSLYIGFNWYRLLTDRIADDPEGIDAIAAILAGAAQ